MPRDSNKKSFKRLHSCCKTIFFWWNQQQFTSRAVYDKLLTKKLFNGASFGERDVALSQKKLCVDISLRLPLTAYNNNALSWIIKFHLNLNRIHSISSTPTHTSSRRESLMQRSTNKRTQITKQKKLRRTRLKACVLRKLCHQSHIYRTLKFPAIKVIASIERSRCCHIWLRFYSLIFCLFVYSSRSLFSVLKKFSFLPSRVKCWK